MKRKSIKVTFFDNQGNVIKQVQRANWREEMRKKQQQMQLFKFIYLDKNGNVLEEFERTCFSKKHAIDISKTILEVTLDNDLHKIKTRKITTLK